MSFIHLQIQKIKPNLDIYQDFLSRYHLKANECLFVDDLKENIDAAIKVGMKGFGLSSKYTRVRKIYRKYLIKVWIIIFYDKYHTFSLPINIL